MAAMDLPSRLTAVLRLDPDATAVQDRGAWYPWAELARTAAAADRALSAAALSEGTAIGVILRNRWTSVAALPSLFTPRRCVVCISPVQPDATLTEEVQGLGLSAVLGDRE